MEQKDWKIVLDWIKKDLQRITSSVSEFDASRREKAKEILNKWKVNSLDSTSLFSGINTFGYEMFLASIMI